MEKRLLTFSEISSLRRVTGKLENAYDMMDKMPTQMRLVKAILVRVLMDFVLEIAQVI